MLFFRYCTSLYHWTSDIPARFEARREVLKGEKCTYVEARHLDHVPTEPPKSQRLLVCDRFASPMLLLEEVYWLNNSQHRPLSNDLFASRAWRTGSVDLGML